MIPLWGITTFPKPTLALDFAGATSLDSRVTFSRGSQATYFDSTGTLRYAANNLLLQSEDFSTTWTASSVTPTTNTTTAPNGTTTADTITPAATTAFHGILQSATVMASQLYAASCYVKTNGAPLCQLVYDDGASNGAFINFNTATGAITRGPENAGTGTGAFGSVTAVGNGWFRVVIGARHGSTTGRVIIQPLPTGAGNAGINSTQTTVAGDALFLWGAMLNIGSTAGDYVQTVASAYYAPRFDTNPSTLAPLGLLIEEQRTNSIRNNTMVGAVAGTPGTLPTNWQGSATTNGLSRQIVGTGTSNGINYIDIRYSGTTTGPAFVNWLFTEPGTQVVASNGQSWTTSAWVALVGGTTTNLTNLSQRIRFNDAAGVELTQAAVDLLSLTSQFQRLSVSLTATNASTAFVTQTFSFQFNSGVAIDFTLRIGLPQLEQGAFATSVIPTTTTALTRNADVASMTGTNFSSWYSASEGTVYSEYARVGSSNFQSVAVISDNSTSNVIALAFGSGSPSNNQRFDINVSGVNQASITVLTNPAINTAFKTIGAYKANDFAATASGNAPGTDTSGTVPTVNRLQIGTNGDGSGGFLNGTIRSIRYYPVRLPDSTLQALTA